MASRRIETEIDRLYQLPLDGFTAARNALAKTAGSDAADVRGLAKPPIAAWAVNQVYWTRRAVYDALVEASSELRKVHQAILGGRRADLREAAKVHDAAVEAALKAALDTLHAAGHPQTDATRQAVATTLRALPAADPPGRLTRTLQPGGFEMLAGLSIAGPKGSSRLTAPAPPRAAAAAPRKSSAKADPKAEAARAEAARALREAEQAARRDEFEAVRLTRDAEKAARQVEQAREALDVATEALAEAEAAAAAAVRARDEASRRVQASERAAESARRRYDGVRGA